MPNFISQISVTILSLLSVISLHAASLTESSNSEVPASNLIESQLLQVLKRTGDELNVGIVVENAVTGQVLYSKNADRYFMPASNQKLFTAFAALQYLGPTFTYQTQLFADLKKLSNGILYDHIYIKFSGDPTLTITQLNQLLQSLTEAGVHRINGSIIIDDTAFDHTGMSPGTSWDDQSYCFAAPVSAMILDHNCVSAAVKPAAKPGRNAQIILPEHPQFMRFINQVTTAAADSDYCQPHADQNQEMAITLSGCIKAGDTPKSFILPIHNPRAYVQTAILYALNHQMVMTTHDIQYAKVPAEVPMIASVKSEPVQTMVTTMLKNSDNLIANALFKTIGEHYLQKQGSWRTGSEAIRQILANALSNDYAKLPLVDGAGTSRYNFVTPKQLVNLIRAVSLQPYHAAFLTSLPIAGVDGTLRDRMKDPALYSRVFAKTGSMTAVTSLAGLLQTKNQQTLIFSILINGFVESEQKYKLLEDHICKILVENL